MPPFFRMRGTDSAERRVAVVGSGLSGLAVARSMATQADVTLFEAARRFGGHSHTVDVTLQGRTHPVDTGFLVFNRLNYPELAGLLDKLGVQSDPTEMSLSVQVRAERLEWSGRSAIAL